MREPLEFPGVMVNTLKNPADATLASVCFAAGNVCYDAVSHFSTNFLNPCNRGRRCCYSAETGTVKSFGEEALHRELARQGEACSGGKVELEGSKIAKIDRGPTEQDVMFASG